MTRLGKLRVKRKSRHRNPDMFNVTTAKLMRLVADIEAAKL